MKDFSPSSSPASLLYRGAAGSSPETAENGAVFGGALLKGKELPVLKPLNMSGFGFPSLKRPSVWLHYGTRGHRNGLRGLEFGAEAKDSGEVKIISISCD